MKPIRIFLPLLCAGLAGCASAPKDGRFSVTSEPAGAEVFVMGDSKGVTPVTLSLAEVFPNIYPPEKQALYGRVVLRHEGCEERTYPISSGVVAHGIKAKLNCEAAAPLAVPRSAESVGQRLERLQELLQKGIISEGEYKTQRERILNEL